MSNQLHFITWDSSQRILYCRDNWTVKNIMLLQQHLAQLDLSNPIQLDLHGIQQLDTAGAWLICNLMQQYTINADQLLHCSSQHRELLQLVQQQINPPSTATHPKLSGLARCGKATIDSLKQIADFFNFVGESCLRLWDWIRRPQHILWRNILQTIETSGYQALPIIGLLSFLIGIVLTYQMGLQLRNYGGNIFIVNLLGLAIVREFAPLMTAILIAGRSGSAFTAQIGTMQINQEIDALRTMGVSPITQLVLPKLIGLNISLPLLTIWSCITGIFGGMVMSKHMLGIGYYDFLIRFANVIPIKTLIIGISKTPLFALIITWIGCLQGFRVRGSADSVGRQTTKSVVQAIFLIICADAAYSILLSWYNL